jgi:hypothetical protein
MARVQLKMRLMDWLSLVLLAVVIVAFVLRTFAVFGGVVNGIGLIAFILLVAIQAKKVVEGRPWKTGW